MKFITGNITINSGKAVHLAFWDEEYFTLCGADHATNKAWPRKILTNRPVSCKKCIKKSAQMRETNE